MSGCSPRIDIDSRGIYVYTAKLAGKIQLSPADVAFMTRLKGFGEQCRATRV